MLKIYVIRNKDDGRFWYYGSHFWGFERCTRFYIKPHQAKVTLKKLRTKYQKNVELVEFDVIERTVVDNI